MRYSVGQVIYNRVTDEQGHIVRVTDVGGKLAYVVRVPSDAFWAEREALWQEYDVKTLSQSPSPSSSHTNRLDNSTGSKHADPD